MIRTEDIELRGIAKVYSDVTEMVEMAVAHGRKYESQPQDNESWLGRGFPGGWSEVATACQKPWQDGLFEVQDMLEEVGREVPPPRTIKRQGRWSPVNGDVSVGKVLSGQPNFRREVSRSPRIHVPQNVTVVCNVGNTADWNFKDIFWRGAAGIAAIDLLEKAGYCCEVWIYNLAAHAFGSNYGLYSPAVTGLSTSLAACKIKSSGEPLDIDTMVNATSAWFFRTVIFELRKDDVRYTGSKKHVVMGGSHDRLGEWKKYFDIENGVTPVFMPAVRTREAAVQAAKGIIEQVTSGESLGV